MTEIDQRELARSMNERSRVERQVQATDRQTKMLAEAIEKAARADWVAKASLVVAAVGTLISIVAYLRP